ncbi:MAG TPA: zf-HC2 domain-containing protein [Actinomycetota bacterium]|nr:zf-HC2 domain-containing protein [Actinomycetota bacterium]
MTTSITHERCSELLGPYARGRLPGDDAAAVERHLEGCEDCRAERQALGALLAAAPAELTDVERAGLHSALQRAVTTPGAPPRRARDRGWRARLAPAVGAAALAGAIAGTYYLAAGGGAPESSNGGTDNAETFVTDTALDEGGGGAAGGSAEHAAAPVPAPEPTFSIVRDPFTGGELTRLGRSALPMVLFSRAYTAQDASRRREDFLERLAGRASETAGEHYGSLVERCAHSVLDADSAKLPAFGVMGELRHDPVMVLGFAWSEDTTGPLDKFDIWAWPRDSCDAPVDHRMGWIHAGD